jgi:hypothetical protein
MTRCRGLLVFVMFALSLLVSHSIRAQVAGALLSGVVTDASGAAVPNANVSIKSAATGVTHDVTKDFPPPYKQASYSASALRKR